MLMPSPQQDGVSLAIIEGVATLTLNRPKQGNALSASVVEALHDRLDSILTTRSIHTLVLRSAGRHLCTGFDLSDLHAESDATLLYRFVRIEQLLGRLWTAPIKTVVVGQGRIWGAGADLFAACDVRLATPTTEFRFPGAGFGIVLGTRRLAHRIGRDAARRIVLEGTILSASEAHSTSLVTAIIDEVDAESTLAQYIGSGTIDHQTMVEIHEATADNQNALDLATLVYSAARPGLKQRIESYRARQLASLSSPPSLSR